jgi:hypothetical protein
MTNRAPSPPLSLPRLVGVAFALLASACSLILKTDESQCATDDDCHKRGAAFANAVCVANICQKVTDPLACIGSVKPPPAPPPGKVSITMAFHDTVTQTQLGAGISVRPCPKLDFSCTTPVGPAVKTDASGSATLDLPAGFDGYLEIDNGTKTVPALWYFSPVPIKDGTYNVALLSPTSFDRIAAGVGATIDPNAGHAFIFALDCTSTYGTFAAGMSFSSDQGSAETSAFYLINGIPSKKATATDASGVGGFANLPPGTVTVTASVAATGARSGSISALIRTGVITYAPIAPSN